MGKELYGKVKEKIDAANASEPDKLKHIRYADLSDGEYVSKDKYTAVLGENENLSGQIKTLNATIAELKKNNSGNEKLQNTITALQDDLKKQQEENMRIVKTSALKEKLSKEGVVDPDYLIYKAGGIDNFTFDKKNNPVGVSDIVQSYKKDDTFAYLFKQEPKKPPYNPKSGGEDNADNPFAEETFNMTKQGELLKSNPEQARAMAAAAGVKI